MRSGCRSGARLGFRSRLTALLRRAGAAHFEASGRDLRRSYEGRICRWSRLTDRRRHPRRRRVRLAQVRPAVLLPVVDHADALGEALEGRVLARLARPGFGLPQPVEIGVGQAGIAVFEQVERAFRFAQLAAAASAPSRRPGGRAGPSARPRRCARPGDAADRSSRSCAGVNLARTVYALACCATACAAIAALALC